jgi:hypothetical protein
MGFIRLCGATVGGDGGDGLQFMKSASIVDGSGTAPGWEPGGEMGNVDGGRQGTIPGAGIASVSVSHSGIVGSSTSLEPISCISVEKSSACGGRGVGVAGVKTDS